MVCTHPNRVINFNPRSHGGSDKKYAQEKNGKLISIHAPTGGATISQAKSETAVYNFNPRSHGGSDWMGTGDLADLGISIHAPTGGATLGAKILLDPNTISIHAPTGGATVM